jgi:hypothetical protein
LCLDLIQQPNWVRNEFKWFGNRVAGTERMAGGDAPGTPRRLPIAVQQPDWTLTWNVASRRPDFRLPKHLPLNDIPVTVFTAALRLRRITTVRLRRITTVRPPAS